MQAATRKAEDATDVPKLDKRSRVGLISKLRTRNSAQISGICFVATCSGKKDLVLSPLPFLGTARATLQMTLDGERAFRTVTMLPGAILFEADMLFLFIEDDVDSAEAFAALAASLGHQSHLAHDGGAALRMAASTAYDAIFMDIGLPDIDGLTLCKYIRSAGNSTHACIVAVTGRVDLEEAEISEFDGYVTKPMTESGLTRIIQGC